ncbi:hypothetical protein MKW98_026038 [Papaver atlanticum]|uniref:Uncharacterized protein n=1 Tax=Papaver atlanticum TaxID=357466 RepID=A0AAD4RXY4_9MAGN|nr:hypothetical protein MKW98_026038 [Papaver atlanticum]
MSILFAMMTLRFSFVPTILLQMTILLAKIAFWYLLRITLGTKMGGAEFKHPQIHEAQLVFYNTYLKGEAGMTKKVIIDSLYVAAGDISKPDDFVKLLVLYLCVTVFFADKTGSPLPSRYLDYVFAMDQYWFAEVTYFISKTEGEPGNSNPRILRWNTRVLAEKIQNEGISSLKKDLTGSFIDSLDEGEQSLVTPIEIRQISSDRIGEKMVRNRDRNGDSDSFPDRDAEILVVDQSKKIKISIEEPRPYEEGNVNYNYEPEHLPSSEPMIPAIPILPNQESGAKENENDVLCTSAKDLHGNGVHIENLLSFSEAHTTGVESLEVVELVEQPVDATVDTSFSNSQTLDSTLLTIPTSVDVIPSLNVSTSASAKERVEEFQSMDIFQIPEENENDTPHTSVQSLNCQDIHIGNSSSCSEEETMGIEPLEVVELVKEPMNATRDASSSICLTLDPTLLNVVSTNVTPSPTGCKSASAQERIEGFEFVGNLKIPEEYKTLYKKIYDKYGHMATKVTKFDDAKLLTCVTNLLKIISVMETVRGAELSVAMMERWEGFIREAEILEFNIKWLREGFSRLKNHWKSSFRVDIDIESHEQVLDAKQGKYVGLLTRKEELETELSEVNIEIRKAEAEISSDQEAIQEKQTKKNKFQHEPVLGIVLHELNF